MKDLKQIMCEVLDRNRYLDKDGLFNKVMDKVKKECFLTQEELKLVADELAERLMNY